MGNVIQVLFFVISGDEVHIGREVISQHAANLFCLAVNLQYVSNCMLDVDRVFVELDGFLLLRHQECVLERYCGVRSQPIDCVTLIQAYTVHLRPCNVECANQPTKAEQRRTVCGPNMLFDRHLKKFAGLCRDVSDIPALLFVSDQHVQAWNGQIERCRLPTGMPATRPTYSGE